MALLDKNGCEFRVGDHLLNDEWPATRLVVLHVGSEYVSCGLVSDHFTQGYASRFISILKRADGSKPEPFVETRPAATIRYASGEEPRVGDVVRDTRGYFTQNLIVSEVITGSVVGVFSHGEGAALLTLDRCSLVSRAEPDPRPVLGKDRDGRDVRKGDRVRCGCGKPDDCEISLEPEHHDAAGMRVTRSRAPDVIMFEDAMFGIDTKRAVLFGIDTKRAVLVTDNAPPQSPSLPAEPAASLTFPVCPDCGERLVSDKCAQDACIRIARLAAARKVEAEIHERFAAFQIAVADAVKGTRAKVTTDLVMPSAKLASGCFVAEVRLLDRRRILTFSPSQTGIGKVAALMASMLRQLSEEIGRSYMRAK